MRLAVTLLCVVHGAIHLLGFLKASGIAQVPSLSGRTLWPLPPGGVRVVGILWLVATLALLATALMHALGHRHWWMVGAGSLLLSQALIVLQWHNAKAGTLANLLLALAVLVAGATARFEAQTEQEVSDLIAHGRDQATPITPERLSALPSPVQRWLRRSGALDAPPAAIVRLLQRGGLRTAPDRPFSQATATQTFRVEPPGFIWRVDVTMMGLPIAGRDRFVNGRGRMLITLAGLFAVADGTGPRFDEGTAQRYLAEIIWFPSAAWSKAISWEPIDANHARARLRVGDIDTTVSFTIDAEGRVTQLFARRYLDGKTLEDWLIPITEWRRVRGIEMPVRGHARWKLKSGDFDYFEWEILDVEAEPAAP